MTQIGRVERSATACVHTPNQPRGYLQWHSWAHEASKTHAQVRCPHCGLWQVWLPKPEARRINATDRKEERRVIRMTKAAYGKGRTR